MTPASIYTVSDDQRLCDQLNAELLMRAYHAAVLATNGDTLAVFEAPLLKPGVVQRPWRERSN